MADDQSTVVIPSPPAPADRVECLPLHAIDPAPATWNPKTFDQKYRRRLDAGLDHFGLRDHLKVWPRPDQPGRYYMLDGNQRLDWCRRRNLEFIDCRVLVDLEPEDARLFTASFNRNHAVYKEADLSALFDELSAGHPDPKFLDTVLRPQRSFVAPTTPGLPSVYTRDDRPASEDNGKSGSPAAAMGGDAPALVPVMFSLTREGYQLLEATLLKAKARTVRAANLQKAAAHLADADIDDSVVAETALRIYAAHVAVKAPDLAAELLDAV